MTDNKTNIPYQVSGIDRLVGLAIVVALILASMATVRHFRETAPLDEVIHYHTLLKRAYGIAQGADIRLAGISIGKVGDVVLERTGKVRLEIRIERKYQEFVTRGSHLEIASTMGLAAIVDLTKLNFVSNPETDELLSPGALIETVEPMDLADALNSSEIAKMAENIKTILASSAELSAAMARNQELTIALGDPLPVGCLILPIKVRGKIVAFFYGDSGNQPLGSVPMADFKRLMAKTDIAFQVYLLKGKIRVI